MNVREFTFHFYSKLVSCLTDGKPVKLMRDITCKRSQMMEI